MAQSGRYKVFTSAETAFFCEQLALMINSGVSVYDGVYNIYEDCQEGRGKATIKAVYDAVQGNSSLHDALQATGAFPIYMVHLVEVGEQTGRLEEVLVSLSSYYERDSKIKAQIRSAVAYPIILFAILSFIMAFLAWKILPMFQRMFDEISKDVSNATSASLATGMTAGRICAIVVLIVMLLIIAGVITWTIPGGRVFMNSMFAKLPLTANISRLMATSRFISSLSLTISSGMDLVQGLEQEERDCQDPTVRARIAECLRLYRDSNSFEDSICRSGVLQGMESRLLAIAAKSGEADATFRKFGLDYDERVGIALNRLTSRIETILVVMLSLMVGAVLISVMIPLANLIAAVG